MIRTLLALLFALALPASGLAAGPTPGVDLDLDLDLDPIPEVNVKDAQLKTAKAMNPALKILPLAMGLPLAIAGLSVANTSPIAYGEGLTGVYPGMRRVGLSLMGGALATNILLNTLSRTSRLFSGGEWQKDMAFLAGGIGAAIGGYVLVGVGTSNTVVLPDGTLLIDNPGAVGGILAGASVSWTVGSLLLIVDAFKTAMDNDAQLASRATSGPQFAGFWVAPSLQGGASGGLAFLW